MQAYISYYFHMFNVVCFVILFLILKVGMVHPISQQQIVQPQTPPPPPPPNTNSQGYIQDHHMPRECSFDLAFNLFAKKNLLFYSLKI